MKTTMICAVPTQNPCPRCGVAQAEWGEGPTTACEQCGQEFELAGAAVVVVADGRVVKNGVVDAAKRAD